MKTITVFTIALGVLGGIVAISQIQAQAPTPAGGRSGPGVQAAADSKEPDVLKTCKTPPQARGGGPGGAKGGGAKGGDGAKGGAKGPAPTYPVDYKVTEIPGVVAAGAQWKEVWQVDGNNADGLIGTKDGGILIAQNDNSKVMKLDKNGKVSEAYTGTNTGGSVAMSAKGALFVANRGLNPSIEQLAPVRKTLANKYQDDPMDCIGVVLNDITADSKGGVYFTMGTVYYADPKGKVTRYGQMLNTNGIMLSPDEKHLYVTNGASLVEFDVEKDGSLTNQRDFAKWDSGSGDGSTFDTAGRFYVTTNAGGIKVIGPDGKFLGTIPAPRPVLSMTFSGPDRKTIYAVSRVGDKDWIIALPMLSQGTKGRGK
jgi:sugar lactone lactonase YvrE